MFIATIIFVGSMALLALSMSVAAVILASGFLTSLLSPVSFLSSLGSSAWNQSQSYLLTSIPFFILFGEIFVRSGIAGKMYEAIVPWLNHIPGKLMQTNIMTSALFAATSGSSVATAATISSVAIPEIKKGNYNERLFLGSIASGGTLGILIPPSINLIIYGALTRTSIPELYLGGLIPGLILTALFSIVILFACYFRPDWDGTSLPTSWSDRLRSLPALLPPVAVFLIVVGSIYAGIATATEAAALGVVTSLILAAIYRKLTVHLLNECILSTMRTTAMLLLIFIAASFLHFALGFVGFVGVVQSAFENSGLGPYGTIALIVACYFVLGCFLDGLSMTVLTVPILAPVVAAQGFDLVWFGILVVLATEMGLLTPPVGMNCYVVQGVRKSGSLTDVFVGVSPFLIAILLFICAIIVFPEIVLWLPGFVRG